MKEQQIPSESGEVSREVPEWATAPFQRFLRDLERVQQLLHLSTSGIAHLRSLPELVEVMLKSTSDERRSTIDELEKARKEASLAQIELDEGFPILHSQAVVTLWTLMEAAVRSFAAVWLENEPAALDCEPVQKLRVRFSDYLRLQDSERFEYMAELLETEVAAGRRNGVERFEAVLDALGFSGAVPDVTKRNVYELGQVRNAIVHRGGVADRQLVRACPWLTFEVGEAFRITPQMFLRYALAASKYITLLIGRVQEHFGRDTTEHRTAIEDAGSGADADSLVRTPVHESSGRA